MTENGKWNTITVDGNDTVFHKADVVFEGGGVKGIGLAYAVKAFEARGYVDWARVAGTSAGGNHGGLHRVWRNRRGRCPCAL